MKFGFLLIAAAIGVAFILAIIANICKIGNRAIAGQNAKEIPETEEVKINFTVAHRINETTSIENSPLRSECEDFGDGLDREINQRKSGSLPENHLMDIRKFISE